MKTLVKQDNKELIENTEKEKSGKRKWGEWSKFHPYESVPYKFHSYKNVK